MTKYDCVDEFHQYNIEQKKPISKKKKIKSLIPFMKVKNSQ